MNFDKLYKEARKICKGRRLSDYAACGSVGSALLSKDDNIYTGICIDTCSSLGFCAEHSAISGLLKHKESEIIEIVAVGEDGIVMPPCGRCRELIGQINLKNRDTIVHLPEGRHKKLRNLLPDHWIGEEVPEDNA